MGSIGSVIGGMGLFFTGFLILHLLPVWIYLASVIFLSRRYANTYYIVTDRSIYVSGGVFRKSLKQNHFLNCLKLIYIVVILIKYLVSEILWPRVISLKE